MNFFLKMVILVTGFILLINFNLYPCTTILVTAGASEDGSVMVTHADDNELCDERIIYVPAMDHPSGSWRMVYPSAVALGEMPEYNCFLEPRLVCPERGPGYDTPIYPATVPLGSIPQIEHTYSYFDGSYGIINEHQLMIGECTNGAKIQLQAEPGRRIFYSSELSRVALERCKTAREAVLLIGKLIEQYGYYGTGETLLLGDAEEGWVLEMCCGTPDSTGGLWVARRVPHGEVFVAANEFRIRDIDPEDPDLLYSENFFDIIQEMGWWKPEDGTLDWLRAVSLGEYNHPYYSLRRVWRVLTLVAPSSDLSPWVEDGFTRDYPFSIKPDKPLELRDVMNLHRDHYEGTPFDMTKGMAAGPFGFPNRYYGPYDGQGDIGDPDRPLQGAWERPLSVSYCGYVYVNQARSWMPEPWGGICWMGLDRPSETCYIPLYASMNDLPASLQNCNTAEFSRESAWWVFNAVSNWSSLKYSYIREDIKHLQDSIENAEISKVMTIDSISRQYLEQGKSMEELKSYISDQCYVNTEQVVNRWWEFFEQLIVFYDDGYLNSPIRMAQEVGYPQWWIDSVGWSNGPTSYEKPSP
ncbi:MAG: dipeptidase [bacterium]